METYAIDFWKYIRDNELDNFTHRDILLNTTSNCSYSTFRCFKKLLDTKGLKLIDKWEEKINSKNQKKKYKRYYIEVA